MLAIALLMSLNSAWAKKPPIARRHQTIISNISPTSVTIQEDSGPKTFAVTAFTEITVNDQRASIADLRNGMRVSVILADPTRLRQLKAWSTQ